MAEQPQDRELKNALAQIEKQFGKGAIMQLGEGSVSDVQGISSGALSLDIALGGRGLPRGRRCWGCARLNRRRSPRLIAAPGRCGTGLGRKGALPRRGGWRAPSRTPR